MRGRLIGRETELGSLQEWLDDGGFTAVIGPAGIGKTALVRAAVADRRHHVGGGLSMLLQRPYAALETAVRERLVGPPTEVAAEVHRLVEGVLVVEDLHWADPLTVEVLGMLVGEVALVVTTRPDPGAAASALVRRARRIDLSPLPDRQASQLARRLHPALDDARRTSLLEVAGGNPLLIERLVDEGLQVSPTLDAAVAGRLRLLRDDDRRAVAMVALLGRPAAPELVSVADDQQLLAVRDDGSLELRHAALASGVLALFDDEERRQLHAGLADRLDDAEGAAHDLAAGRAERASCRAERAAAETDHPAARADLLRLAAVAAEQCDASPARVDALWAGAVEALVAAGRWADAVEAAARVSGADPVVAADVLVQRGRASWFLGEVEAARRDFGAAEALIAPVDECGATRVVVERAYLEVRDRRPGSLALAEAAVERAEAAGVEVLRARSNLGAALLYEGRPEWESVLRDVLAQVRAAGDAPLEAMTAYHLASGLGFHGRLVEAVAIEGEQIPRAQASGLGTWTTHFEQARLIQRAAMSIDPLAVLEDADRLLLTAPMFRNRFQLHLAKILALLDLGRFTGASRAVSAFSDEVRPDDAEATTALAATLGELAWHLDDVEMARRALALGRPVADAYFGIHLLTERTCAHVLVRHGLPVTSELPKVAMPTWWPALHEIEGLRRLQEGDARAAAEELHRASREFEAMSLPRWAVRAGLAAVDAHPGDRAAPAARRRLVELARRAGLLGTLRSLAVPVHRALTPTEELVLRRIAAGDRTRDVASAFDMAPATVDHHVEAARRKLGAPTRLAAALRVGVWEET